jgi:hypothetical protein
MSRPSFGTGEKRMANMTERASERLNTSSFHATSANAYIYDDAEPLPAMFTRARAAGLATIERRSHAKACFSLLIIALVLLAFAAFQALLLLSSFPREQTIEDALALAKKGAAHVADFISIPTASAAVSSRSKSLASERLPSFADREWSAAVANFKRLLAEQKLSQASATQIENDRLIKNLEAWMSARARS